MFEADNSTTSLSSTGGSSIEDAEFCCIGCLIVSGDVSVTNVEGTSWVNTIRYSGTITVTTITMCLNGIPCNGEPSDFVSLSCDEFVKRKNEENPSVMRGGWGGVNPAEAARDGLRPGDPPYGGAEEWIQLQPDAYCVFWNEQYVKLGCCTGSCSDKSNSKTYNVGGTVATTDWGDSFMNQSMANYGFGGSTPPEFAPCCKK